ncbi:phosphoenolpyruvate-dependent sugar phosphotransferase system EIIA 2 [Roseburia sp. CAG:309]|nr:phosphoenolpyruvate-dependent sugar phosphotransferase system EIIA 2 [Roseburia sp. CAG:309]
MKIIDLLDDKSIRLNAEVHSKKEALDTLVDLMDASGKLNDIETYRKGVYAREEEGSTGIGEGIAIPHCKSAAVNQAGLAAMVVPKGVEFDSLDGEPANLFFLIAAPDTADNVHLDVLSHLSVLLMDPDFTGKLREAETVEEFKKVIEMAENEPEEEKEQTEVDANVPYVLAVTGCPTGIAHTYMAAEALERKAEELGYQIKVETRGSSGAKNVLTAEEIAKADGIIVAADTKVPMERFDGKPVIITKVADGINKPEELIRKIVDKQAPVYESEKAQETVSENTEKKGIGHAVYQHLMSGVSHMLPFVIGGGIMMAIAFLIDTLCGYGSTGGANFGSCTPLSALFKYIGGLAMGLMVPVLSGYIAYSIADRPGLAVGFTGGLLAANGNAILGSYVFADKVGDLGGFSKFVAQFAFVGKNGGNTVSGFLGGIVAGFLAGFIVLGLKKLCEKLPDSLDGIKPTLIYPLVGIFIIGVLMCMIFNPLIGLINTGLSNMLKGISDAGMITVLGLILGAMMAIDMGGPINKAAYVFGSGMLATASQMMEQGAQASDPAVQACYMAMAAIMVGGMVPPVGIAVACKLFPNKFTQAERGSALSNIVMGCSFITEGAIPFAASDPLHVIPCTMAGAGVAGFLSALFKCTLMAPHGGIFVFATVGQPLLYVVAWLAGSAVTAVMLGLIKKDAVTK